MTSTRRLLLPLVLLFLYTSSPAQTIFYRILGPSTGSQFGFTVDGAGDTDGDGFSDFLVGAPSSGPKPAGDVFLFSGFTGALLQTISGSSALNGYDRLGWSVSGLGDVNGDGVPDFGVTANGWSELAPEVRIYDGNSAAILFHHPGLGWSVSGAGDVDADGFPDVLAGGGSPGSLLFGKAKVLSGRGGAVLLSWASQDPTDLFGWSVSGAGDVDGDGRMDLLVGAPWDDTQAVDAGRVWLYSGADGTAMQTYDGMSMSDQFGWSVGGGGDVDGGGKPDPLIGAPFDTALPGGGRVGVFSGETGSPIAWLSGASPGDAFGTAVRDTGDLDGDGLADLVVGAPGVDAQGIDSGRAYAFSGVSGSVLWVLDGQAPLDAMGTSAAPAGDVNQDGFQDLIAGASAPGGHGLAVVYSGFCSSAVPWITQQPQDVALCFGQTIFLAVAASGPPAITYQWRKDGLPIPDRTQPILVIGSAVFDDAGTYDVVVANCGGSVTSAPAVVTLDQGVPPATITQQPENVSVCAGNPAQFVVAASGQGSLSYQWRKNGVPIPGAVQTLYTIFSVTVDDAGVYDVLVINCGGAAVSDPAVLAVNSGVPPPVITRPPQSLATCVGDPFELRVDVSGAPPISVQWRRNGVILPGASGFVYRVSSATFADAGTYDAMASNCVGTVTSPPASVRVAATSPYGVGTPGTGCTPILFTGCPNLGTTTALIVFGGMGGAPGTVLLGTASANIPLLGGTLLVQPLVASLPVMMGGIPGVPCSGTGSAPLAIPNTPSLSGTSLFVQGFIVDPGAPGGVAMTQGVQLLIG